MSKKETLLINELKPGMISASSINFNNKVLLADGMTITESVIDTLKHNYIVDKVDILIDDDNNDSKDKNGTQKYIKIKTAKELENEFTEFSPKLKNIFDILYVSKKPRIDEVRNFTQRIEQNFASTGTVIRNILYYGSKGDSIFKHSINVAAISFILGKWLGLNVNEINLLIYSATLHDIGKTKIDKSIIENEGKLSDQEYKIFKLHPVVGYNLINQIPFLDSAVSYGILMHHEMLDGSGYPLGLKGNKINKFAKIIAIADLFDNTVSGRSDGKASSALDALEAVRKASFGKLEHEYCEMFLSNLANYFMGEEVILNNKIKCKIVQFYKGDLTRPLLLGDDGLIDLRKEKKLYIEKFVV